MNMKIEHVHIRTDVEIGMLITGYETYGESYECGDGRIINYIHDEVFCNLNGNKTITVNCLIPEEYDTRLSYN